MFETAPIVELDDDPTPNALEAFWFTAKDDLRLRAALSPAEGKNKGSILLLPGRTEYIEKYFEFIRQMNAKGLTVAVIDHRGQGLSDRLLKNRLLGHVDDFSDYAQDVETLWQLIKDKMLGPRFLLAHSMGGAIATDVARRGNIKFDKMACGSPMLGFAAGGKALATFIGILAGLGLKKIQPPGVSGGGALDPEAAKILTSDPVRFDRDIRRNTIEPKLQLGGPTVGWLNAALKLHRSFWNDGNLQKIEMPVYFAMAGKEKLVSNEQIKHACELIPNAQFEIYQDALHEIPQERDELRDQFMRRLFEFLEV